MRDESPWASRPTWHHRQNPTSLRNTRNLLSVDPQDKTLDHKQLSSTTWFAKVADFRPDVTQKAAQIEEQYSRILDERYRENQFVHKNN